MILFCIITCLFSIVFAVAITSKKEKIEEPIKTKRTWGKRTNKKYWGKIVEVESWTWTEVFYWIEEIDEEGDVIVRESEEYWKKNNPDKKIDYQVIIRNIE